MESHYHDLGRLSRRTLQTFPLQTFIISRIFPSFGWGIFFHVTHLDQLHVSENIRWIINRYIKQLLDEVSVVCGIIKAKVNVISLSLQLRLITLTETLIISDITKT